MTRQLYSLKVFMMNNWDVIRNENRELRNSKDPAVRRSGYARDIKMAMSMAFVGATLHEIRDFIEGKKTPMSERVMYGFLELAGVNPFVVAKGKKEGLAGVMKDEFLPISVAQPLKWFDEAGKIARGKDNGKWEQHIPIFGDFIYGQTHKK